MTVPRRRGGGRSGCGKILLMGQDFVLVDGKIPIEDIEHFAFHPTDIPVLEDA